MSRFTAMLKATCQESQVLMSCEPFVSLVTFTRQCSPKYTELKPIKKQYYLCVRATKQYMTVHINIYAVMWKNWLQPMTKHPVEPPVAAVTSCNHFVYQSVASLCSAETLFGSLRSVGTHLYTAFEFWQNLDSFLCQPSCCRFAAVVGSMLLSQC